MSHISDPNIVIIKEDKMRTSVITTLRIEIEHDKEVDKQDIYNFLAGYTDFRSPFEGQTDGEFSIVDVEVLDDDIEEINCQQQKDLVAQ